MARITYVKKSQAKKNGRDRTCRTCGKVIEVGSPYKWFASLIGRSSRRSDYHTGCSIPRSHRTSSAQLQTLYDALDAAEQAVADAETYDDIETALRDAAEGVREASDMYIESADNMESGFGTATYVSDEIRDKGDQLEQFADELESVDLDEFDEDAAREDVEAEQFTPEGEDPNQGLIDDGVEEKRQEWLDEQREKANSALSDSPM